LNFGLPSRVDAAPAVVLTPHVLLTIRVVLSLRAARSCDGGVASTRPRRVSRLSARLLAPVRSLAALSAVRERGIGGKRAK
jgi:hypothetical protein